MIIIPLCLRDAVSVVDRVSFHLFFFFFSSWLLFDISVFIVVEFDRKFQDGKCPTKSQTLLFLSIDLAYSGVLFLDAATLIRPGAPDALPAAPSGSSGRRALLLAGVSRDAE